MKQSSSKIWTMYLGRNLSITYLVEFVALQMLIYTITIFIEKVLSSKHFIGNQCNCKILGTNCVRNPTFHQYQAQEGKT
jgi:hypothetical protein